MVRNEQLLESRGEYLGTFINKWRGREVVIWADAQDPSAVITVGTPYGKPVGDPEAETIVAKENRNDWQGTLQRIRDAAPEIYVYE